MFALVAVPHDNVFDVACSSELPDKLLFDDQASRSDHAVFLNIDNHQDFVSFVLSGVELIEPLVEILLAHLTHLR